MSSHSGRMHFLAAASFVLLPCACLSAQVSVVKAKVDPIEPRRLVNAPVAPEAIYIGRRGGVSVVDLNGFGQGTGSYRLYSDPAYRYGFKRNPNLGQPGVHPPYSPARSNDDAGSAGALTLTQDNRGSTLLLEGVDDVSDMALGQPLDLVYNNENINSFATVLNQYNPFQKRTMPGNSIALAPIPNPPRLITPAPNPTRGIEAEEPTVASHLRPPCFTSANNKLVVGDPFALTQAGLGVFYTALPRRFYGPQPQPPTPAPPVPYCPYSSRQQVGHFLYVMDRVQKRIHIVNSNRMTRLRSIAIGSKQSSDLTEIAMAPNLKSLAIADGGQGLVHFVDTDPNSRSFHKVLGSIRVPRGATRLAWQPEGEALLVTNARTSSLAIIDGSSFTVRRATGSQLSNPVGVAVSSRQFRLGIKTWTWFAFVLNGDGSLSVFESGPKPIGPASIRSTGLRFAKATSIQIGATLDPTCYIAHQDAFGQATVSQIETVVDARGVRSWKLRRRIGGTTATTRHRDLLSGRVVADIAFDEVENKGSHKEYVSALYPSLPKAVHSSKGLARWQGNAVVAASSPRFLFVALSDSDRVDVIDLTSGRRLRSLRASGMQSLASYWRQ